MLAVAIRHAFPGFTLDLAFAAPVPGTTVLFGASGSGKSTVVNAIAGLLRPDAGRIALDETVLFDRSETMDVPPERRGLGVVFQDSRLFPHLSVETNLRYGARRARGRPDVTGFDSVVDLLGISHLLARRPHNLSGGERQRVAIGRALLAQPRLLLMDEPLSGLDAARKSEILPYLARLKTALTLPIVYVTHALDEVARLADTLVLLEHGRCVAAGPLAELSARSDLLLAARDDAAAIIAMRVHSHDHTRRLTLLEADALRLFVPLVAAVPGTALRVRVPAREPILATRAPSEVSLHNVIEGTVRVITEDAARHSTMVEVRVGNACLLSRVTPDAIAHLRLAPGRPVLVLIKSMSIDVLLP
jgi:molybdate transport system ATP-binding protein